METQKNNTSTLTISVLFVLGLGLLGLGLYFVFTPNSKNQNPPDSKNQNPPGHAIPPKVDAPPTQQNSTKIKIAGVVTAVCIMGIIIYYGYGYFKPRNYRAPHSLRNNRRRSNIHTIYTREHTPQQRLSEQHRPSYSAILMVSITLSLGINELFNKSIQSLQKHSSWARTVLSWCPRFIISIVHHLIGIYITYLIHPRIGTLHRFADRLIGYLWRGNQEEGEHNWGEGHRIG